MLLMTERLTLNVAHGKEERPIVPGAALKQTPLQPQQMPILARPMVMAPPITREGTMLSTTSMRNSSKLMGTRSY